MKGLGDSMKDVNQKKTYSVVGTTTGSDTGMNFLEAGIPIRKPFPRNIQGELLGRASIF